MVRREAPTCAGETQRADDITQRGVRQPLPMRVLMALFVSFGAEFAQDIVASIAAAVAMIVESTLAIVRPAGSVVVSCGTTAASVGSAVGGVGVGAPVGTWVGASVGSNGAAVVGGAVGDAVCGGSVGALVVGRSVGGVVGTPCSAGPRDGNAVGGIVGGAGVGTIATATCTELTAVALIRAVASVPEAAAANNTPPPPPLKSATTALCRVEPKEPTAAGSDAKVLEVEVLLTATSTCATTASVTVPDCRARAFLLLELKIVPTQPAHAVGTQAHAVGYVPQLASTKTTASAHFWVAPSESVYSSESVHRIGLEESHAVGTSHEYVAAYCGTAWRALSSAPWTSAELPCMTLVIPALNPEPSEPYARAKLVR